MENIDFAFLDGGHSFETVFNDLNLVFNKISSNKDAIILCDDYEDADYITGVKRAVDQFVKEKKLKFFINYLKFSILMKVVFFTTKFKLLGIFIVFCI